MEHEHTQIIALDTLTPSDISFEGATGTLGHVLSTAVGVEGASKPTLLGAGRSAGVKEIRV